MLMGWEWGWRKTRLFNLQPVSHQKHVKTPGPVPEAIKQRLCALPWQ